MIIETLPIETDAREVVLYVRRHVRRVAAEGKASPADLARYFGIDDGLALRLELTAAAKSEAPIAETARRLARIAPSGRTVVELPHDTAYLARCADWLRARVRAEDAFNRIVATDPATLLVLSQAIDAAERVPEVGGMQRPILITGASGTGKELLADAIYRCAVNRGRIRKAFETLHVAGMTADMINDELFGHVKGAFTGAQSARAGKMEAADGGILFIDEVGDLPREAQLRLLRFLQDQRFSRIGSNNSKVAHVQVIAATWHDLDEDVKKGEFRLDLLHRLRALHLHLPRLNDRVDFAGPVLDEMLLRNGHVAGRRVRSTFRTAIANHAWEGNLRELNFALAEAMINAGRSELQVEDLPASVRASYAKLPPPFRGAAEIADAAADVAHRDEQLATVIPRVDATLRAQKRSVPECTLHAIQELLQRIPDPTSARAATARDVERGLAAWATLHARLEDLAEWKWIRESLPEAGALLRAHVEALEAEVAGLRDENTVERVFIEIAKTPLGRLYHELSLTPLAMLDNGDFIRRLIPIVISAIETLSPDLLKTLYAVVGQGGLPALREAIVESASDETPGADKAPQTPEQRKAVALRWNAEQWTTAFKKSGTVAALSRLSGMSERAVRDRLDLHHIAHRRSTPLAKPPSAKASPGRPRRALATRS